MNAQCKKFDVVIVGAGLSGMYQLIKVRKLGLSARVLEMGSDVGGTLYWNRYPGARFDSESYSYGMSFSKELLEEWEWSEHFSAQPETLRYCQHISEKFDLRRDIEFNKRVIGARYNEASKFWCVMTADDKFECRFFITAVGVFSEPTLPAIEGINDFKGEAWHTARWPHDTVDFSDKRVAVIGTGAIVTLKSPLEHINTVGRWNFYDILVTPQVISVSLNGKKVSSLDLPNKSSGFVALQREKEGRIRFRKMTVQPIAQ